MLEATLGYLNPSDLILDVGCGDGTLTDSIAKNVSSIEAIDISTKMIEIAKSHTSQKNIHFKKSTLEDAGYKSHQFDAVLAFNVLHFIEHKQDLSQRIFDLIKPGGYFISCTACAGDHFSLLRIALLILMKCRLIPRLSFLKTSELQRCLANVGFEIIKTENLSDLPDHFIVVQKPQTNPAAVAQQSLCKSLHCF